MFSVDTDIDIQLTIAKILQIFDSHKGIILFGAGENGNKWGKILDRYGLLKGFIDNDIKKQCEGFNGSPVFNVDSGLKLNALIVITPYGKYSDEIESQLNVNGLIRGYDYISLEEFEMQWFKIILFYRFNVLYTDLAQICVTERCTLKCIKCAHACNKVPINSVDISLEEAKKSADYFFYTFDMVNEFVLIGGEPFLFKDLDRLLEYICVRYRKKMNMFSITTNGTIIPNSNIMKICKENDVVIRISDYSRTLPRLTDRYQDLYRVLDKNEVQYIVWETDDKNSWVDYGFDTLTPKNIKQAIRTYQECRTPCREISGNQYYYCVMAHTVSKNMQLGLGGDDYLNLENCKEREKVLLFELGYSKKGYLDMCKICRGKDARKFAIPAAIQDKD